MTRGLAAVIHIRERSMTKGGAAVLRIILASHGGMAAGAKDTAEMILGELPNVSTVSTTRDETESIVHPVERLLAGWPKDDAVFVLTDVLGGSVNNDLLGLVPRYPNLNLICGMNMSLILNLAALEEAPDTDDLAEIMAQAREEIVDCGAALQNAALVEEDDL